MNKRKLQLEEAAAISLIYVNENVERRQKIPELLQEPLDIFWSVIEILRGGGLASLCPNVLLKEK